MRIVPVLLCFALCLGVALPVHAEQGDVDPYEPTRYGLGLLAGTTYDPEQIGLVLVQGQLLADYDRIFWHSAPEALRLKFETNVGVTTDGQYRGLFSINMLALYYFGQQGPGHWTPYGEAGIGVIFTDFQVDGQGLRINFNPQAGVGVEYGFEEGGALVTALRLHHISNGNTYKENRGVNSILFMVGYLF